MDGNANSHTAKESQSTSLKHYRRKTISKRYTPKNTKNSEVGSFNG